MIATIAKLFFCSDRSEHKETGVSKHDGDTKGSRPKQNLHFTCMRDCRIYIHSMRLHVSVLAYLPYANIKSTICFVTNFKNSLWIVVDVLHNRYQWIQKFNIPPRATPWAFDILNFRLVKFPSPGPKMVFKCPTSGSYWVIKCLYLRDIHGKNV